MNIHPAAVNGLLQGSSRLTGLEAMFQELFSQEFSLYGRGESDDSCTSSNEDEVPPLDDCSLSSSDSSSAGDPNPMEDFMDEFIQEILNTPIESDAEDADDEDAQSELDEWDLYDGGEEDANHQHESTGEGAGYPTDLSINLGITWRATTTTSFSMKM